MPLSTNEKNELLGHLRQHATALTKNEQARDKLLDARNAAAKRLYLDGGMSLGEIGEACGLTATGIMRALRKAGVDTSKGTAKSGPRKHDADE